MHRKNIILVSLFFLFSAAGCLADGEGLSSQNTLRPLSAQELAAYRQHERLPFAEDYSDGLNGTFFHVRYRNETVKGLDARPLLKQSTIVLDGKTYLYDGPQPTSLFIQAGKDSLFFTSPDFYVPKVKRGVLADSLRRWRWVSGISQGTHTLSLQFGGRHYGPVQYNQPGTDAWLVPHE